MKTGKAYAFLDYKGTDDGLMASLERARVVCNFDDLKFEIVGPEDRKRLPAKLIEVAQRTLVYGAVDITKRKTPQEDAQVQKRFSRAQRMEPKPAYSLDHLVVVRGPRVYGDRTTYGERRNSGAGDLHTMLGTVAEENYKNGIFFSVVFFRNWQGNYERD